MDSRGHGTFADMLSQRIRSGSHGLATRWFSRLNATVPLQPDQIFPRQGSHDRIPDLINEIGKFVAADGDAAGSSFMIAEARQLGTLRHEQHASVHQLFHEYDLLRGILDAFTLEESREVHTAPAADVIGAMRRIDQAISLLTRVTVDTFVEACAQTMHEQAKTLEQFNRLVSHELRQPLTALQAAAPLLRNGRDGARRERVVGAIERNVARLVELVSTITKAAAARTNGRRVGWQRVSLTVVATEAARQLRETAAARHVQMRIELHMPEVVVDTASLELMLTNLLSNAIKYSDPNKSRRYVEVILVSHTDKACVIQVRDNGIGIALEDQREIFAPFYRGQSSRDKTLRVDGLGLGLAIVHDCARTLEAEVSVDSAPAKGTSIASASCGRTATETGKS
jgi:signal transduction histidine kinase